MLYPTPDDWSRWGISDECHQFFSLHWTELFDPDTPDTWQVRTCNAKSLMAEIESLARTPGTHPGTFRPLLEEAIGMVGRDIILAERFPFVADYLGTWPKGDVAADKVGELGRLAAVIRGNLADYWQAGMQLLEAELRTPKPGEKKRLYDLTMNVAVETAARGHSPDHLRQTFIRSVLTVSGVPFADRVKGVFDDLAADPAGYRCVFKVEGVRHDLAPHFPSDVALTIGKRPDPMAGPAVEFFQNVATDEVCLAVTTRAADPEAAHRQAVQRLGQVLAGVNLYSIERRLDLKRTKALVEPAGGGPGVLTAGRRGLGSHYLGSYEALQDRAELLFNAMRPGGSPDAARVTAAVQYHRLALQAGTDEARLVNLWIAIEALFERDDGSIIGRVCDGVAPCVAVDNLRKTLVGLAVYVRFWWRRQKSEVEFLKLFPNSTERTLDPDDLCRVLLLPSDAPEVKELFRLCAGHLLIRHRLFRAGRMILGEPKEVAANLEFTHRNVGWQLRRIYRARNAIVHTGHGGEALPQLTQHLHSYFMKTLNALLVELDRRPRWTLREAVEHRRRLYGHVVNFYRTTPGHQIARRSLLDAGNCLTVQEEPFAWTPAVAGPQS